MSENKEVFLFGYSGHSYVIIESLLECGYFIKGYFDYREAAVNPYNLEYFGFEENVDLKNIVGNNLVFPSIGDGLIRKKLVGLFETHNLKQFSIVDPSAQVSFSARIGLSTYIGKNAVVNAQSKIGKGVILNTGCVVEHECSLGDFVHVAPGAILCGNVKAGELTFIGASSVVRQNILISNKVTIGAGAVITKNIEDSETWVGNPGRRVL